MRKKIPKTKEEARQYAIWYQNWMTEQNLSYSEIAYWQGVFLAVGKNFGLLKEFKENGII